MLPVAILTSPPEVYDPAYAYTIEAQVVLYTNILCHLDVCCTPLLFASLQEDAITAVGFCLVVVDAVLTIKDSFLSNGKWSIDKFNLATSHRVLPEQPCTRLYMYIGKQ